MADVGQVINQVSAAAYQIAAAIQGVTQPAPNVYGQVPVSGYPQPTMTPDQLRLSQPATPSMVVAPTSTKTSSGIMVALSTIWSKITGFFRSLLGGGSSVTAAAPTSWPAVNPNAADQLFAMLPSGRGMALGLVPVEAHREGNAYFLSASGYGGATVFNSGGAYFFSVNNQPPTQVSQVSSNRDANGDTHFAITLADGKRIDADIMADGRTLRYKGYTLTLS